MKENNSLVPDLLDPGVAPVQDRHDEGDGMTEQKEQPRKPGIRVDGGKRRDLNVDRVAARMTGLSQHAPSPERVQAGKKLRIKAQRAEDKTVRRLVAANGGKDGAILTNVKVKISDTRSQTKIMRARPGTFEWRYGRNKQDALFHAGNHFAVLWERAGATVASAADFLRGTKSGYATGIGDGRVAAIDALSGAVKALGQFSFERLMLYCVQGLTASDIAQRERQSDRELATVLHHDLRACAIHFKFLASPRRDRSGAETI